MVIEKGLSRSEIITRDTKGIPDSVSERMEQTGAVAAFFSRGQNLDDRFIFFLTQGDKVIQRDGHKWVELYPNPGQD